MKYSTNCDQKLSDASLRDCLGLQGLLLVQEFRGDYSSGGAGAKPKMNPSVPHLIHEISSTERKESYC